MSEITIQCQTQGVALLLQQEAARGVSDDALLFHDGCVVRVRAASPTALEAAAAGTRACATRLRQQAQRYRQQVQLPEA